MTKQAVYQAKYRKSIKGKIALFKYNKSEKGRLNRKKSKLKERYSISFMEYTKLFDSQNGSCAICHLVTRLEVDHDHKTGKVRGLLCHPCNCRIGTLEDEEFKSKAKEYLFKGLQYV